MNFKSFLGAIFGTLLFSGQAFATSAAPAHYTSPLTCTRNFYVSPAGTDNATCGAGPLNNAANCATPWGADAASNIGNLGTGGLTGGDCVNVLGTTPTETATGSSGWTAYNSAGAINLNRSGTANQANGYINYVCSVNHGCYMSLTAATGSDFINLNGNYIALDGFELDGHNIQGYNGYNANNTNTYNVGGGAIFGPHGGNRHLIINNISHGAGAGVLGEGSNDYYYYIANEAYDGSGVNGAHTSVSNFYDVKATTPGPGIWDTNPYRIQLIGNVIHDGGETVLIGSGHTDGNGITFDDWANTQSNHVQYPNKGLAAYNLIYNIGGRGGLIYEDANATYENNTFWNNCLDPSVTANRTCHDFEFGTDGANPGGGWNQLGTSDIFINNLSIRANNNDQGALSFNSGNANGITNNLTFDSIAGSGQSIAVGGGVDLATIQANNPLLGTPPALTNPSALDFHPLARSPVLGAGTTNIVTQFALQTPDGQTPPSTPNVGAFNLLCTPNCPPPPPLGVPGPVSINAGGPAVPPFIADDGFAISHGGVANNNPTGAVDTSLVVNPAPTAVYRTERWDSPFTYTINSLVPNQPYSVRLHFTEDWPADITAGVGARVMNVTMNGTQVLTNFDILAATSGVGNKAVEKHFSQNADANGLITITFTAVAGHTDANAKVDGIEVLPMPTATLSANPTTINSGNSSTLTWSSTNSTRCIGTGFSTGNATSGTLVVSPTSNTTYSVACDAGGVAATASQTIAVNATLSATLTASPTTVVAGGASTLTWASNATTKCVGTGFATANATSGSVVVNPAATTTYSVACDSGGTPVNASVTVFVTATTANLSASPSTILNGQTSTLTWSTNGTRCVGTGFSTGNAPAGTLAVNPTANTTYSVACDNGGPSQTANATVTVTAITASLSANPTTLSSNSTLVNSTGASIGGSRSTTASSGAPSKAYFEFTLGSGISNANTMIGIANPSESLTSTVGVDLNGVGWQWSTGDIFINNAHTNINFVTGVANDVIGFAVDFANQKLWVKNVTHNGGWNNDVIANQNPSTNTGGYSISGLNPGPYFITADVGATNGEKIILNAGGAAFAIGTNIPSGFSAWGTTTTFDPAHVGSPATVNSANSSILTWSSNGTRCLGTGFATANAASGTQSVSPTMTTTYSVACDAGGAATTANATVTVNSTPSASIMSNNTAVTSNTATISWSSVNAVACTGTNFQTGGAISGSVSVSPLVTTTYTVTCDTSPPSSVTIIVPLISCQSNPPFTCTLTGALSPPPSNLIAHSQTFTDASWSKNNLTVTGAATSAPDGSTTASRLNEDATLNTHFIYPTVGVMSPATSQTYSLSVYYKSVTGRDAGILVTDLGGGDGVYSYASSSGTVSSSGTWGSGFTLVSTSVVTDSLATGSGGNGWYRITLTFTTPANATLFSHIHIVKTGLATYTGDGTSGVYIWGSQLTSGSALFPYMPTP